MPIRRFPVIAYRGLWILPYSTRRCAKKDYIVLDAEPPKGKKIHGGWFRNLESAEAQADKYLSSKK